MAILEPFSIRAGQISARFNPSVIAVNGFACLDEVPADTLLPVLFEKQFDIFAQVTLISFPPEFWISSYRSRNAPNDVWDDHVAHFDLGLRENVSRYAR